MGICNYASIYYGYKIKGEALEQEVSPKAIEDYIDDDWYIGEYYGQGFCYQGWDGDDYIVGIECFETDDSMAINPFALDGIRKDTREELIKIYHILFPNRDNDYEEPQFILFSRQF